MERKTNGKREKKGEMDVYARVTETIDPLKLRTLSAHTRVLELGSIVVKHRSYTNLN